MPAEALPVATPSKPSLRLRSAYHLWLWLPFLACTAHAQTCQTSGDMDAAVRTAIENTAQHYFDLSARGDTSTLKLNSIPSVANSFAGIEAAVKENQLAFAGAKATERPSFLLTADGPEPIARAEFLCGIFGKSGQTKDSAVFVLPNLPPGKYGVAILDVSGPNSAMTLTMVLQQLGADWKLAGFFPRSSQAAGHDAAWFIQSARDFKAKSQTHNSWLYYREAVALSAPADFMSTQATDRLYDEIQASQPADVPGNGATIDLSAGGKAYQLIDVFPLAVGNDLDVVVKYQAADVSDTGLAFRENSAIIKALLAKFPELRNAFAGVVARAVDPSGRDYGTLLAMKDIK
jgi:hypothetical protein